MEFETYQDVIDAFERDNMGYDTLTDYIKGENIKIAEIDISPMSDLKKALGAKDGGMMIAIEQLGRGGITGGKTYHQYHDQFVPPDSESEMYANGGGVGSMMKPKKKIPQLVKPNKDGSRPGYRGPGGYQGGATNQGGAGKGSSGSSGNTGGGGGGGSTAREKGIMSRYQGPKGTTKSISNFRDTGPDRSAVGQFSQYGRNVMNQNLTRDNPSRRGGIGGFLSGIIPTLLGFVNPFVGMAARGIMGIPKGIVNFNNKIQNSDFGKSTSLADYLDIRSYGGFDEREEARKNTMSSAKDLQARIDAGEFGGPNLQTNNSKPTANIQGTNLNDFEIGNPGKYATADALTEANMADYQTSLVDEFTPGGIDRTNLYEDFTDNRDLISETATSPQFNTSLIDEFGDNRNINMDEFADNNMQMQNYLTDQANYNADPFGNPNMDPRVVPEEFGLVGNQIPQGIPFTNAQAIKAMTQPIEAFKNTGPFTVSGNTSPPSSPFTNQSYGIMDPYQQNYLGDQGRSVTTGIYESPNQASLPGNNMVAEITQKDIDRFKQPMTQMMDYDTYKSINTDSTLTPDEFNQLKAQV